MAHQAQLTQLTRCRRYDNGRCATHQPMAMLVNGLASLLLMLTEHDAAGPQSLFTAHELN